jgi:hypothetical protein
MGSCKPTEVATGTDNVGGMAWKVGLPAGAASEAGSGAQPPEPLILCMRAKGVGE